MIEHFPIDEAPEEFGWGEGLCPDCFQRREDERMTRNIVLVTGGRDFSDTELFVWAMSRWPPTHIVTGDASGADQLARHYASAWGIPLLVGVANWTHHGKSAGPKRNMAMVGVCRIDMVLAFPGGAGTKNCVEHARASGVPVVNVEHEFAMHLPVKPEDQVTEQEAERIAKRVMDNQ